MDMPPFGIKFIFGNTYNHLQVGGERLPPSKKLQQLPQLQQQQRTYFSGTLAIKQPCLERLCGAPEEWPGGQLSALYTTIVRQRRAHQTDAP
jgi:hypothetical protein